MSNVIIVPNTYVPPRCPSCDHLESIERVCRHCGYVYGDTPAWLTALVFLIVIVGGLWLCVTLMGWLAPGYYGSERTLLNVLKGQWHWLTRIRLW